MIPPDRCPYKNLTAPPCWRCNYHIADTDSCKLNPFDSQSQAISYTASADSYHKLMERYEQDRRKLMELSKEALVDLILKKPSWY